MTKLNIFLLVTISSFSLSLKTEINQLPDSVFSMGISRYLKDVYNAPQYAQEYLPNNFSHMIELLDHGRQTEQSSTYFKSVLRLFVNKPLAYVNAYAFNELLLALPLTLQDRMVISKERQLQGLHEIINEMLYRSFLSDFPAFKANPKNFLDSLSQDLEDAAEMRKLLMLFLHSSVSKLIWSPEDQHETWDTVKAIAHQLHHLNELTMIVDQEDLNTLYVNLVDRYCFFLDISDQHLAAQTYEKIQQDIRNNSTPLLELDEQEELIQRKADKLIETLMHGHARALARDADMVLRPIK